MQLGVDLGYLDRISCPQEKVVELVKMALRTHEESGQDPLVIDGFIDCCVVNEQGVEMIGLDLSRGAQGIIEPLGRKLRIGVHRWNGELVVMVVDPNGSRRTVEVSTCDIQAGELIVLDNDFTKWRERDCLDQVWTQEALLLIQSAGGNGRRSQWVAVPRGRW